MTEPSNIQYKLFYENIKKIGNILDDISESIPDNDYKEMYEALMDLYQNGIIKTEVLKFIQRRSKPRAEREPRTIEWKLQRKGKTGEKIYELCEFCDRCINLKGRNRDGMRQHHETLLCKHIRASKTHSQKTRKFLKDEMQNSYVSLDDHFILKREWGLSTKKKQTLADHGVDITNLPIHFI
jgi:hypothetical protein